MHVNLVVKLRVGDVWDHVMDVPKAVLEHVVLIAEMDVVVVLEHAE